MSIEDKPLFAISIAPAAKGWLLETQQAYVQQVFKTVINIVNQEGNVLTLASKKIGNSPFSLVLPIDSFSDVISTDLPVKAFEDGLWVGDLLILASKAKEWDARPHWSRVRHHEGNIPWTAKQIGSLLEAHAQPESLARLILDPLAALPMPARIVQMAEQSIPPLFEAVNQVDNEKLAQAAKQLAGMGPGLTPAGDDLLVGVMHGLWAILSEEKAAALSQTIAKVAIARTNTLSAAWLAAAARGEAAEPWHQLLDAIADENPATLQKAVMRILPTGHTSGADALGGFLGVLQTIKA